MGKTTAGKTSGVSSGIPHLDRILAGLNIGDNVVWYDDAGSLAQLFCRNFIRSSLDLEKPVIYVSFDRSPKNLLAQLGPLAQSPHLVILDCFTHGKGAGSDVFLAFYREASGDRRCLVERVGNPRDTQAVMDAFYGTHRRMQGDVRFVFESLTGMQALWGGEEQIAGFYSHSCPRLYELRTVAYWIVEKKAHSIALRARINQIAQVAVDLSVRRGRTYLTVIKAENRDVAQLNKPVPYGSRGSKPVFDPGRGATGRGEIGLRLRELRTRSGLSQTQMSRRVGVTPSTISQIEGNLIYPSLPALIKMAEVLAVDIGEFFPRSSDVDRVMFPSADAAAVKSPPFGKKGIAGKLLIPFDFGARIEAHLIEIAPGKKAAPHFFTHKGPEFGYLISGALQFHLKTEVFTAGTGDAICFKSAPPEQWRNVGDETARLLWIKVS